MKKIILSIIALLTLLVGSSLGIYYFVDINNYKTDIAEFVRKETGNNIIINGDVRLRMLPDIALDINRVSMPSPNSGGQEDAIYIKQLILHLKILPLFRKNIEVASVNMISPEVKYTVFKDGSNNFSKAIVPEILAADKKTKKNPEIIPEVKPKNYATQREFINSRIIDKYNLGRITATDAKMIYTDERKGIFVALGNVNLETSFLPEINPIKISGNLEASPGINMPFDLMAKYHLEKDKYEISGIEMGLGGVKTHGEIFTNFLEALPEVKVTFYFEDMDMTPYAGLVDLIAASAAANIVAETPEAKNLKSEKADEPFVWSSEPIDFMALRNFNANLNFKSNKIIYKDTNIGSITIYAYLINGKFTLSLKEAEVFGGNINSETSIDITSTVPKIKYKLNLEEVDLGALPQKFVVVNKFAGKVNGGTMLTSTGVSPKEIISNLKGEISLKAENGFIKDIDLTAMAKNDSNAFDMEKAVGSKTEFKELSGDFGIIDGAIRSENIQLNSDVLDFNGQGTINLPTMTLTMMLIPKLKRTKDEKDILGGIKAPILLSGNLLQPSFRLEIQTLVEDVIKNPKGTENLVKQLKRDFKDIKNNMKSDEDDNKSSGFFDDIKNVLKGF